MSLLFIFIHRTVSKFKWLALFLFLFLIGIAIFLALRLKLSEDITKILPESKTLNNISFVFSNAKLMEKVIINIQLSDTNSQPDPSLLAEFAEMISDSLKTGLVPEYIQSIDEAPDDQAMLELYDLIYNHLPVFLTDSDYEKLDSIINPSNIAKTLEGNYKNLVSPLGLGVKTIIKKDPLHFTPIALNKFRQLQVSDDFKLFNGFFMTKNEKNIILLITPVHTNRTADNQYLFEKIDLMIANMTKGKFSGVKVDYFGNAVVALGNATRVKQDIVITLSLALILLLFFISFFFRKIQTFLIIFSPVVIGAVISLAVLYLTRSEVSAISLGIGSVLFGISVDYGLHVYSHFRKNGDIQSIFKDITAPIILSSLTTAGAFFTLHFVSSDILSDLGLFAGISILATAFLSLTFIPALLGKNTGESSRYKPGLIDKLTEKPFHNNKILVGAIFVLTVFFFFYSKKVGFDSDMMKSNYMSEELKQTEENLNNLTSLSRKTVYIVTPGKTLDEALKNNAATEKLIDSLTGTETIQDATVITRLIKSDKEQQQAIEKWKQFWQPRKPILQNELAKHGKSFGFNENAFQQFIGWIDSDFNTIQPGDNAVFDGLLTDNYTIVTDTLAAVINQVKVKSTEEDLNKIYSAFSGTESSWIVDKRLITREFVNILKNSINQLVYLSLALVFIILLLAFGRIELTLITMIPMVFSWIWTVGLMGLFGISFNIFNIIILTFIFGLGIDYSIFIMRGLQLDYKYGNHDISTYKVSVIISAITTLMGIGVLIFAKHPALRSIAAMSIIGILNVIIITFILIPVMFRWLVSYKKGKRNRPVTLLDLVFSLASLIVFVSGALLMSLLSVLLRIIPFNKKKKKYFFHIVFSKLTWFLIYMNFLSPKKIINPEKEKFNKPALIIANHQSHIDLMLMMLLHPKVLILTNRRNYTHPFYGKALQYADFIPSDMGYEEMLAALNELIKDGYSFMIFPEGHRNDDGSIRRFHQGAFYLADKLNIDILPIIIHGQNQLLKKSEFFLKRGSITTKFLPRINLKDNNFGSTIKEQTKGINRWFRKEYALVREEFETPDYWSDYIKKNFIYKGPVLEWYTRIKISLEDNYRLFNDIIPRNCIITDLGCGYGYLDFILGLISTGRDILAIDYDEEKIATAANCAIKKANIEFRTADISMIELRPSDVFILNDVLHYLKKEKQLETIEKCIEQLNLSGKIIIRESDSGLQKRHVGTRISEFFSTGTGFNKTANKLEFLSREDFIRISEKRGLTLEIIDNTRLNANLVFILKK